MTHDSKNAGNIGNVLTMFQYFVLRVCCRCFVLSLASLRFLPIFVFLRCGPVFVAPGCSNVQRAARFSPAAARFCSVSALMPVGHGCEAKAKVWSLCTAV